MGSRGCVEPFCMVSVSWLLSSWFHNFLLIRFSSLKSNPYKNGVPGCSVLALPRFLLNIFNIWDFSLSYSVFLLDCISVSTSSFIGYFLNDLTQFLSSIPWFGFICLIYSSYGLIGSSIAVGLCLSGILGIIVVFLIVCKISIRCGLYPGVTYVCTLLVSRGWLYST